MPTGRVSFGAAALNDRIYVVGGGILVPDVWEYTPASNTWAVKAQIPTSRGTLAAVVVNEKILALGGDIGVPGGSNAVEEYNPTSDTWASRPNMPTGRNECFAAIIDGTLYAFGGYDKFSMIASDSWNLADGLVAYYPFNGNANDESGNGNNPTEVTATPTVDRFGNNNSAYAFDGVSSMILVPDSQSLRIANDITVSCWLNLTEPNLNVRFLGKGGDCGRNFGLYGSTESTFWMFQQFPPQGGCVGCQENTASTEPIVQLDNWYQLVGVRSGNVSRLYLDGILLQERSPICSDDTYTGDEPLIIGAHGYSNPQQKLDLMRGNLDEIRIYNRALSPVEVMELHEHESFTPIARRATAVATVVNGFLVDVQVTNPGWGYDEPPFVRIFGGGGNGAVITPVVRDGKVQELIVSDAGMGYSQVPSILIASPPFSPSLAIAVSKVRVTMSVVLGRTYQLESSLDLDSWNDVGEPFIALEEEIEQEFDVVESGRFFRILEVQ